MKKIISLCVAFMMIFTFAAAEDPSNLAASWKADCKNNKLTVTVTATAKYNQRITAVMYPYGGSNSAADWSRVSEVTATPSAAAQVTFTIGDDLTAAGGKYTVSLAGNGTDSADCKKDITVYILRPADIPALLTELNGVTGIDDTMAAINAVKDALQLKIDDALMSKQAAFFVNMRTDDFNGIFADLNEVAQAWNLAEIAVYISGDTANAAGARTLIEAAADYIGINITDDDYIAYADKIYADIIRVRNTYNNGKGISSISAIKNSLAEYTAVEAVNGAAAADMPAVLDKYHSVIGITDLQMTAFKALSENNRAKVTRQLYNKNYTETAAIKTDFDAAMAQDFGGNDTAGTVTGGGGGGNKKGGAAGGASLTPSVTPSTDTNIDFADLGADHWAYGYVNTLRSSKIIDGYEDGTFRPDNSVTREEFVKMIVSASGLYSASAECEFGDVQNGQWYYKYISSAVSAGLVNGVSEDTFGTGGLITREDAAVIAARILDKFGKKVNAESAVFTDANLISDYAADSINTLAALGIISGQPDGSFEPQGALTRAQAARIIVLVRDNI